MNLKRYDLYFIIFILLIIATFVFLPREEVSAVVFGTESGNVTVQVEVARTEEELRTGLMNRPELPEGSGMLFIFERPQLLTFWMKNTLIALDMIFVSEDGKIIKIDRNVPPCQAEACPNYGGVYGKYVVEVNAGFCDAHGIMEGDKVYLLVVKQ